MKKTGLVLLSLLALAVGACSQIPGLTPTPGTGPTVNPDDLFNTAVAQTLTAQPARPSASATETQVEPTASPVAAASETATATIPVTDTALPPPTNTAVIDLSATAATATASIATATQIPFDGSATATLAAGQLTASPTLGIRTFGTLPPAVPYSQITLINKARAEAYISLQVTMPDGRYSIIEYPVTGRIRIQAPVGSYLYVAWVGGRKMVGEFRLNNNDDSTITLYRDRVEVR